MLWILDFFYDLGLFEFSIANQILRAWWKKNFFEKYLTKLVKGYILELGTEWNLGTPWRLLFLSAN